MLLRRDWNREGDGVCVYIRREIAFNARNDIGGDLETIWTEVCLPKTKPMFVGVCYRPPKQLDFFSLLENTCMTCQNISDSEYILLGDFNTDYQQINSKTNKQTNKQN